MRFRKTGITNNCGEEFSRSGRKGGLRTCSREHVAAESCRGIDTGPRFPEGGRGGVFQTSRVSDRPVRRRVGNFRRKKKKKNRRRDRNDNRVERASNIIYLRAHPHSRAAPQYTDTIRSSILHYYDYYITLLQHYSYVHTYATTTITPARVVYVRSTGCRASRGTRPVTNRVFFVNGRTTVTDRYFDSGYKIRIALEYYFL